MLLALTLIFTLSISTGQVSPLTFQSLPRSLHRMPSVRLRIQLTGANMQIHGQSVFDVFANPILSAAENSLHYDGFAHFIQEDYQFTYVFVNGIGYVVESKGNETTSVASQTTRCLSSISPFDDIIAALNNLTAISSESVGDDSLVDCPNGCLYGTSFGGKDFLVCVGIDGLLAYGGDIMMSAEYLASPLKSISAPTLTDGSEPCTILAQATPVSRATRTLLSGKIGSRSCTIVRNLD
ncbi:hypothetical protein F444_00345 [Phytophthora nicotianae P1976]|uniref:Peptidase A1 domain-containing protein n=1 Tax=Phytophthora nicotianae P1976 TaxID=1317066 RepID=A0A081B4L5_PHYNI|nr:hypothetical protein F444_00345 [Phytophthora nicotianae P1976]